MPRPILGYIQRVLDEHELAVEAALTCDRSVLRRAFSRAWWRSAFPTWMPA